MTWERLLLVILAFTVAGLLWRQMLLRAREAKLLLLRRVFDGELRRFEADRQLLKSLLAHSSDHVYFKDFHGCFLLASQSVADSLGVADPDDLVGKTDFDFFSKREAFESLDDEQAILKTGHPMPVHVNAKHWPDGRVRWRSTCKWPLRDRAGGIFGTFGISRDVTEEVKLREENERLFRGLARREAAPGPSRPESNPPVLERES